MYRGGFLLSGPAHGRPPRHAPPHQRRPVSEARGPGASSRKRIHPALRRAAAWQSSFHPRLYRELVLRHRSAPYEMLLMGKALHDPGLSCGRGRRIS